MKTLQKGFRKAKEIATNKYMFSAMVTSALLTNGITLVNGANGTEKMDLFIDFISSWLVKIGGMIALVGAVMFALGWQREDADGKSRGLMTVMAGFMLVGIAATTSIFVSKG